MRLRDIQRLNIIQEGANSDFKERIIKTGGGSNRECPSRVRRERSNVNESNIVQLKESGMHMKHLVDVKIGMEDADFYIKRRGSLETVGKPSKSYDEYAIGIKVKDRGLLHPDYLYYWFEHLYNTGHWKSVAKGTTDLVNITMDDLRNIEFR